jgi:TatA/E family protein of Tat protein translocase
MFGIGPLELVVILVVALLVFGPKRVPELARTVGRGLAEFRRASQDLRQTLALDELQQDLRRDLTGNQTIHRPKNQPAQAADDVDSGEKPAANTSSTSSTATTGDAGGATDVPAQESLTRVTTEQKHPGELPLGNDHEHHDESADDTNSNTPADSALGNVPVSGSKPPDPRRG